MARKKVKMEWMTNDAARRATFKKRRKGMMKKVSELSTLCDVKACLIVYGHKEQTPEVWPSMSEAARVVARLKRMPEMEQSRKMMNQEGFIRQRMAKLEEQLRKQDRENREVETTVMMNRSMMGEGLEGAGIEEVTRLAWLIEMKMNEVRKRIEAREAKKGVVMKEEEGSVGSAMAVAGEERSPMEVAMEELQRQEWFKDIMNPPISPIVEDIGYAAYNSINNNPWLDAYFP